MKVSLGLLLMAACTASPQPRLQAPLPTAANPGQETILVETTRPAVTRMVLARGELYLLKASGAVGIEGDLARVLPATGRKPAPPTADPVKWFGGSRPEPRYYAIVTGAGAPLSMRTMGGPGAGAITVSLFRLSPAPPAIGAPLETVMVPAREKVSVRSSIKGTAGTTYLLQAVGEVQVGGPGNLGDAEFHDYRADGSGFNEGEAGVDFGVGADEPVIPTSTTGPDHPQRRLKWGAFRMDHTYYLLYAGTGDAIGLNYHDSGGKTGVYKDNDGFLPVSVFALP